MHHRTAASTFNCQPDTLEVEVNAVSLKRKRADGKFEPVSRFTPMNLLWAHEHTVHLHLLSPKLSKFCDVGHVIAPRDRQKLGHDLPGVPADKCILAFDLQVEPNMKGHLAEPGTYELGLLIAGENCGPRECTIELVLSGDWYDSEQEMFAKGFRIRAI
jgi:hypothetical protein